MNQELNASNIGSLDDDSLFGNVENDGVLGYRGNDVGISYEGTDWIAGNQGDDSLFGNQGVDTIYGGKNNDAVYGGQGNDLLRGDLGNDRISGDRGADTVAGGAGSDRFVIGKEQGGATLADADRILDYVWYEDTIELSGSITSADLEILPGTGANASNTILRDRTTNEYLAILQGVQASGEIEVLNNDTTLIRLPIQSEPPNFNTDNETPTIPVEPEISPPPPAVRDIVEDPGNTPDNALNVPVSSSTLVYNNQIGGTDTNDYYIFSLGVENSLSLSLDTWVGNPKITLLDSSQTVINFPQNANDNSISAPLAAGTYYIRVQSPETSITNYNLNLSLTPRLNGITTTGSTEEVQLFTNESSPLINLTPSDSSDTEAFRSDARFAGIDGSGFATVIIDGGIDLDHPFFGDRIVYSYDFADQDTDASDRDGHGTNVSSIVASSDETYPGMAPGADIIHLKVFSDDGAGDFSYTEQALQWVVANAEKYNIASVNMSLGDVQNWTTATSNYGLGDELAQLVEQDVIVVSAAGNDFFKFGSKPGVAYPAADPNSLAVGAVWDGNNGEASWRNGAIDFTTEGDRITSFSQRHPELTDIFAPGAYITGASPDGGTSELPGTSQASPHIAGIAVLAQQLAQQELGRRLTFNEFRDLLQSTGVTINDGDDEDDNVTNTGADYKRVDVLALGEAILQLDSEPPEEPESDLIRYEFAYAYDGQTDDNDYYIGYVYAEADTFEVNTWFDLNSEIDNDTGLNGRYYILNAVAADSNAELGNVYITQYSDVDSSGQDYVPYYFQRGEASGFLGLGSEYDFVVANDKFDDFGHDFAEVDIRLTDGGDDDGTDGGDDGGNDDGNEGNCIQGTGVAETLRGTDEGDCLSGAEGNDTIRGEFGDDTIDGGTGDDLLRGGRNDDLIFGGSGNDHISGQGSDDTLAGGDGDDRLWGEAGDDVLDGGAGDDFLLAWKGNDRIFGGAGIDVFAFDSSHGTDTIVDFTVGEDLIGLKPGLSFENVFVTQDESSTQIRYEGEVLAILNGVTVPLSESDFISL